MVSVELWSIARRAAAHLVAASIRLHHWCGKRRLLAQMRDEQDWATQRWGNRG